MIDNDWSKVVDGLVLDTTREGIIAIDCFTLDVERNWIAPSLPGSD